MAANKRVILVGGLLGCGVLGAIAATAVGVAERNGPGGPPIIAVIDLERVLLSLNERNDRKADLVKRLTNEQTRVDELQDQLKAEAEKIEAMPVGTARTAQVDKVRELKARYEFEVGFTQAQLGKVEFEVFRDFYFKVDSAADELAGKSGYSMVLVNDAAAEMKSDNPEAFKAAIARRRMLFADKSLDITDELIAYMNNQYAAGKK